MDTLRWIPLFLVTVAAASAAIVLLKRVIETDGLGHGHPERLPYRVRDDFLSDAERAFYHLLHATTRDWAIICPKVSLGDLFYANTSDRRRRLAYRNKISQKHVDYVLCDPQSLEPILGVELNDQSHRRSDRIRRDEYVARIFESASLPLVQVPLRRTYNTVELDRLLRAAAQRDSDSSALEDPMPSASVPQSSEGPLEQPALSRDDAPPCPKCGAKMVKRITRRAPHAGQTFWGCPNYPKCRGIRPMRQAQQHTQRKDHNAAAVAGDGA